MTNNNTSGQNIGNPDISAKVIMVTQKPPELANGPIKDEIFQKDIEGIFQSVAGYRIRYISYIKSIVIVTIIGWLIAFALYAELWSITDNSINQLPNFHNPQKGENMMFIPQFWFGIILISFPTILYSFSLITYLSVLYDSRLAEIVKLLTSDNDVKNKFIEIHKNKFQVLKSSSKINKLSISSIGNPIIVPPRDYSNEDYNKNLKRAYSTKAQIMTELIQRLAMKMDGATMTGYIFPVMLLQLIVASAFVVPSLEFARLGVIGIDVFADLCKNQSNQLLTCDYLSFWAISWGIIGAFVYSFISLMDRIPRKDVNPRFFLNVAMRYIFAVALSSVFFLIVNQSSIMILGLNNVASDNFTIGFIAVISFFIGMFPNRYFRIMDSIVESKFRKNFTRDIPLEKFTGISANEATRLWEEGIDNVDQLADSSVQDLYKRTKFNPIRLKSLIGRALLWKYLFGIENMLIALDISKPIIGNVDAEERVKDIQSFPFTDIQGLCSYLFLKKFEKIDITKDKVNTNRVKSLSNKGNGTKRVYISEEGLSQICDMIPNFKEQLVFTATDEEVRQLIMEESNDSVWHKDEITETR